MGRPMSREEAAVEPHGEPSAAEAKSKLEGRQLTSRTASTDWTVPVSDPMLWWQ